MAPKDTKPAVDDAETSKKLLINKLHAATQAIRQTATLVNTVAEAIEKLPLDATTLESLHELLSDLPKAGKRKRGDDGDGKRKRATRDPNAPKRPASAYILFQNDVRAGLKERHAEMPQSELLGLIGQKWHDMGKEDKQKYTEENDKAKKEYAIAKAAYDESLKGPVKPAPVVATTSKKAAPKKKAKTPPKSAPNIESSDDDSSDDSDGESKTEVKDDDDSDDEEVSSSDTEVKARIVKKVKTTGGKSKA